MHIPVLQKEVLQYLNPKPNENFIDCTIGQAGHAQLILEKIGSGGKLLGIDLTAEVLGQIRGKKNLILVCDNFAHLERIVKKQNFQPVSGILFDLGMSSWHLEKSGRGFTFQKEENLDMRYDKRAPLTAEEIINKWSQKEIERILKEYGEERFSRRIAKKIVSYRKQQPIKTTFQLTAIVKQATPRRYHYKRIHPATKTFQALRIAVNDELNNLKRGLQGALKVLGPGGKIAVISFHGLEDKIVKNFFKKYSKKGILKILTKKPVVPSLAERKLNPHCRSAKLRVAIKL